MSRSDGPQLAAWTRAIRRSALEDMLVQTARPDVISLALGLPAPELFPKDDLLGAVTSLLEGDPRALQYGPPASELRAFVARLMKRRGVECSPQQVFLTAGAQQAMSLVARLLLDPRAAILVEQHCYTGFLQVATVQEAKIATVPSHLESGIDVDAVERTLEAGLRPRLLYTMSDGANPTGASIPVPARKRLASLARKFRVPILEDDAYGFLSYDDTDPPAIRAYDPDWVFYLGSFSKTLSPALRTGWVLVPEPFVLPLSSLKESSDINTATLGQRAVAAFVGAGRFDAHLRMLRAEYARRRDALLAAVARHFPSGARWSNPRAGFFTWVELPDGIDSTRLLELALQRERVAFVPGPAFVAGDAEPAVSALRLNFSFSPVTVLEDGVARIARALEYLHGAPVVPAPPAIPAASASPASSPMRPVHPTLAAPPGDPP